jgi:hypothetical protein
VQPTAALVGADAAVRCWWSTRPERVFTTHLTGVAAAPDEPLFHAETIAVPGSITASDTADLVCRATSATATADAVAVTAVHVNVQHVALAANT